MPSRERNRSLAKAALRSGHHVVALLRGRPVNAPAVFHSFMSAGSREAAPKEGQGGLVLF